MTQVTGVVQSKSKAGKSIKIDEIWYSVRDPADLAHIEWKDMVTLEYTKNGDWHNIQGTVTKNSSTTPSSGDAPVTTASTEPQGFPIGEHHYSRGIVRQNSVTNAVATIGHLLSSGILNLSEETVIDHTKMDLSAIAAQVLELAQMFEAYSCGDMKK